MVAGTSSWPGLFPNQQQGGHQSWGQEVARGRKTGKDTIAAVATPEKHLKNTQALQ